MEIERLYISSGHNYFGHHGKVPDNYAAVEVASIECVAGHGIRGDRFFDYKDNYKGQLTFFAAEVYDEMCQALGVYNKTPAVLRRNVLTRGQDLAELIGREFEIEDVRLVGVEECRPCYWMDQAFGSGAEKFLRGRGGLRARILSDGTISVNKIAAV